MELSIKLLKTIGGYSNVVPQLKPFSRRSSKHILNKHKLNACSSQGVARIQFVFTTTILPLHTSQSTTNLHPNNEFFPIIMHFLVPSSL